MSYDDGLDSIQTRSGKNLINYLVTLPKYSNELILNVAHPNDINLMTSMMNLMHYSQAFDIPIETASLMIDSQWIIRVKTELGDPTITVDLNDPAVKKVTNQCKWTPAFSNTSPTVNTSSSNNNSGGNNGIQAKATFLGYGERDWGCTSDFIINGKKVEVEGCPKDKMIYENNQGKALILTYKTGMVEGVKTYYFVDVKK